MSKSTETTNDRVPRVLVRFGKHPSSVWKPHRACGNPIKCMETPSSVWKHHQVYGNTHRVCGNPIECGETPIERGETPINCGETPIERGETSIERGETLVSRVETWGVPRRCRRGAEALPKRCLGVPKRAGLSEREDAGRGGVFKFSILGKIADEVFLNCLDLQIISIYVDGTGVSRTRILSTRRN